MHESLLLTFNHILLTNNIHNSPHVRYIEENIIKLSIGCKHIQIKLAVPFCLLNYPRQLFRRMEIHVWNTLMENVSNKRKILATAWTSTCGGW